MFCFLCRPDLPGRDHVHCRQLGESQNSAVWATEGLHPALQHQAHAAPLVWLASAAAPGRSAVQQHCVSGAQLQRLAGLGRLPEPGGLHDLHRPWHLLLLRHHQRHQGVQPRDVPQQPEGGTVDDSRKWPPTQPQCCDGCCWGQTAQHQGFHHQVVEPAQGWSHGCKTTIHCQCPPTAACPQPRRQPPGRQALQWTGELCLCQGCISATNLLADHKRSN